MTQPGPKTWVLRTWPRMIDREPLPSHADPSINDIGSTSWRQKKKKRKEKKIKHYLQVCYDLMRRKSCLVIGDLGLHAHMYICIQEVDVICPSDLSYTCTVCIDYKKLTILTTLA